MNTKTISASIRGLLLASLIGASQRNAQAIIVTGSELDIGTSTYLDTSLLYSSIAGGKSTAIYTNADYSFIGGGETNIIYTNSDHSVIAGGEANIIYTNSDHNVIAGGQNNIIQTNSEANCIGGGESNYITGNYNVIGGGIVNYASYGYAFIGGGYGNTNNNVYGTIAGGYYNTLIESPYDIGNLGGSSFIGGGGSDTVVGAYSAITGGFANTNYGDGNYIGGGSYNLINSISNNNNFCVIGGGTANEIDTNYGASTIAGGFHNLITTNSDTGTIGGGTQNVVDAPLATIPGGSQAKASLVGQMAYASGSFSRAAGTAQTSVYVERNATSDATPTELFLDGSTAALTVPNNSAWTFDILVVGRSSGGNMASFQILGAVKNNSGTLTTSIFAKNVIYKDISSWDTTVAASGTDLSISVTGDSTNIRWVATVRTAEVVY